MPNLGGVFYANVNAFFLYVYASTITFTWNVVNTMINRHYIRNYAYIHSRWEKEWEKKRGKYLEHEHIYIPPERDLLAMIIMIIIMVLLYVKPLIAFITNTKEQWILVLVRRIEQKKNNINNKGKFILFICGKREKRYSD